MEDEKTGAGCAESSARLTPSFVKSGDRQIFAVELRPGDTTIVSWKKLLKDANRVNSVSAATGHSSSAAAQAAPEAHPLPGQQMENISKDAALPNRFSGVIKKIEKLYMLNPPQGKDSSNVEDLDEIPNDDQYDTKDSFIDDAELDEHFEVDRAAVKHDGFFVNQGKLEFIETTAPSSQQPKKRRRKDLMKDSGKKDDDILPNKHIKVGKTSSGKDVAPVGSTSSYPSQSLTMMREPHEDTKASNQFSSFGSAPRKKSADNTWDLEKQKTGHLSRSANRKPKDPSGSSDVLHHKYQDGGTFAPSTSQSGISAEELEALKQREKHSVREVSDMSMPDSRPMETSKSMQHMHWKDGASVRPKVPSLEKAIRDLEKKVAESRLPVTENMETDISSQAVKRRLPTDIKLKLARVAKLASNHGKISKELINRLNGIVGHLVQLRTLKGNLKIMVNSSLSTKQEKENRFQQIKKEVADMVKLLQHQAGASDDFQEFAPDEKGLPTSKNEMDPAMEDKICELYNLYVDGLDEEIGPQNRKLYSELAQFWPSGLMDNHGIKRAICRSKERKRALVNSSNQDQERIRRKKLSVPKAEPGAVRAEISSDSQSKHFSPLQHSIERLAAASSIRASTSASKQVASTSAVHVPSPRTGLSSERLVKRGKAKGSLISPVDEGALLQKKLKKRKPEVDLHVMPYSVKLPVTLQQGSRENEG